MTDKSEKWNASSDECVESVSLEVNETCLNSYVNLV